MEISVVEFIEGCLALLRLATKLSHMGADVDGVAYRLHWLMNYG
jgi:hypothetical protein